VVHGKEKVYGPTSAALWLNARLNGERPLCSSRSQGFGVGLENRQGAQTHPFLLVRLELTRRAYRLPSGKFIAAVTASLSGHSYTYCTLNHPKHSESKTAHFQVG
jgi:hypothetical protein